MDSSIYKDFLIREEKIHPFLKPIEIRESLAELYQIRKHYFILTDAGKPVYSRFGDEINLSPFFATISAIIAKLQNILCTMPTDCTNRLHSI